MYTEAKLTHISLNELYSPKYAVKQNIGTN